MSRETILVVDADERNLKAARVVLEADGFMVRVATDAVSVLENLKTCNPDMIVMDVQLPGMDAWELARRLKANFATRHIPIIAVTAYGMSSDRAHALAAGFSEFVEKPITTADLPAIIRKHLLSRQ
jgi:two-component system cell cycle response regulator DivK